MQVWRGPFQCYVPVVYPLYNIYEWNNVAGSKPCRNFLQQFHYSQIYQEGRVWQAWSLNSQCSPCRGTQLCPYISCRTRVQQRCIYWNLNMTYSPTRLYEAATPIIRDLVLNAAKVASNKDMQAMIHVCFASAQRQLLLI